LHYVPMVFVHDVIIYSLDRSIMPEVKSLVKAAGGSLIKQADGTLGDIISLVTKGEKLVSHVENIIGMFKGQQNTQGSSIIQSKEPAPPAMNKAPPAAPPAAPPQKISDKGMEAYFTSHEGLKKIADAIDKMVPLIGDLRLSEVKKAIMDNISTEKKGGNNESSTKRKTGNKK